MISVDTLKTSAELSEVATDLFVETVATPEDSSRYILPAQYLLREKPLWMQLEK